MRNVLKYTPIKTRKQYLEYCDILKDLTLKDKRSEDIQDEIGLLTILIEKWQSDQQTLGTTDPVQLLRSLMESRNMKPKDLQVVLDKSKGLISDILNYKKGFSKDIIRKLAEYFKVSQEAFNRPYPLKSTTTNPGINKTREAS